MNTIVLKKLTLQNFKGVRDLQIDFDGKDTTINADNGVGKTSIFDGFTYLLFDKDSQDRQPGDKESNFQIKTYDQNGEVVHGLEHIVTGVLSVNGKDITLSKSYKEKWTRKRGEANKECTGNETTYYIDDVPVRQNDYKAKINEIIDEKIFKLITNPMYFSMKLTKKERQDVLVAILGDVTDEQVIGYRSELEGLRTLLNGEISVEELKLKIAARKKKLNEIKRNIPPRIDECYKSIVDLDFDALGNRRRAITAEIKSLEEQINDKSKAEEEKFKLKNRLKERAFTLESELVALERKIKADVTEQRADIGDKMRTALNNMSRAETEEHMLGRELTLHIGSKAEHEALAEKYRNQWREVSAETLTFETADFMCPTCQQPFKAGDIQDMQLKMQNNWTKDHIARLEKITAHGKEEALLIKDLDKKIADMKEKIDYMGKVLDINKTDYAELKEKLANIQEPSPMENEQYKEMATELFATKKAWEEQPTAAAIDTDLKDRKGRLTAELREVDSKLAIKDMNEERVLRIKQLKAEEKDTADKIAELEGQEVLTEEFIKTKVELLEGGINKKFKHVTFRLFRTQTTNDVVTDECEAMIKGVPFSNSNSASQINAGLDIINTLSEHYGITAPVFIDKAECINRILSTESQLIKLAVSLDKTFNIEIGV